MHRGRIAVPLEKRFWRYVDKTDTCWNWVGHLNSCGYGMIRPGGSIKEKIGSHRAVWFLTFGELPDTLCILHKCDNRRCVNPEHLFLGSIQDNVDDMRRKGRDNYTGRPPSSRRDES